MLRAPEVRFLEMEVKSQRGLPSPASKEYCCAGIMRGLGRSDCTTCSAINPSTGEVIGRYSEGGRSEADLAVTAARKAFDEGTWAGDRQLRSKALFELAQRLEDRAPAIAQMLSLEIGKTKADGL